MQYNLHYVIRQIHGPEITIMNKKFQEKKLEFAPIIQLEAGCGK